MIKEMTGSRKQIAPSSLKDNVGNILLNTKDNVRISPRYTRQVDPMERICKTDIRRQQIQNA